MKGRLILLMLLAIEQHSTAQLACNNWLQAPSEPSYVTVGDLDVSGSQLTVEVNFNRTAPLNAVGGYGFLISKHTGPGNINYAMWPNGCAITTSTGDYLIYEDCPIELNRNYHVALVYDGAYLRFYRNGILNSEVAATGDLVNTDLLTTIAQNTVLGAPIIFPFIGFVNEIRIWNIARSQAQIETYMNASLPSPATIPGLLAYYVFNDLTNKQGNPAFDGILIGSAMLNATNSNCSFLPGPELVVKTNDDTAFCKGSQAHLTATGRATSYNWTPTAGLSNPSIADPVATPASTTQYIVTGSIGATCTAKDTITVTVNPLPIITTSGDETICEGGSIQLTAAGGVEYAWQPGSSLSDPNNANPIASPTNNVEYTVTVTDNNGCKNDTAVKISIAPPMAIQISKSNDIGCGNGSSQLTATGGVFYSWSPSGSLDNSSISNPIASPVATTKYTVHVESAEGCTGEDSITVYLLDVNKANYLMASAFTPNNDNINECYGLKFWGPINELDFSIYNRWGQKVFHTNKPSACWDGTYRGVPQNPGVFVYVVNASTACDPKVFRKGTFMLIR